MESVDTTAGGDPRNVPGAPPAERYPVVCLEGHQFDSSHPPDGPVPIHCPDCGQAVQDQRAVVAAIDPVRLEEITTDTADWWDAAGSVEACFRWLGISSAIVAFENIAFCQGAVLQIRWFERIFIPPPPPTESETTVMRERRRMALSERERAGYCDEMAKLAREIGHAKDRKKAAMDDFKEEIDGLAGQLSEIARRVHDGEDRDVDVELTKNYRNNTVTKVLVETGEVIEERAMTGEERQKQLGLVDGNGKVAPSKSRKRK